MKVDGGAPGQRAISNSRAWYPAVGLLIGLVLAGVELGCSKVFPVPLTAAILLAVATVITRALHLDGLMDICDGVFGGGSPERRLEIMKDPRVGAFGVAGGGTILLLKYGALVSLLDPRLPLATAVGEIELLRAIHLFVEPSKTWALLLFPALSRWAMVVALGAFPYARSSGLGSPFHQGGAKLATVFAAVTVLAASSLLGGPFGVILLVGVTVLALGLGWAMTRALGGLTGDSYGAINEISEVAVLAAAAALAVYGWLRPPLFLT